jgi:hypothetical protein
MMWLRDLLKHDFPDSRIMTWGYHSGVNNENSSTSIPDICQLFLQAMKSIRLDTTVYSEVLFPLGLNQL